MNFVSVLTISLALSLDAFAVMTANYKAYDKAGKKIKIFAVLLFATLHAVFAFLGFLSAEYFFSESAIFEYIVSGIFLLLAVKCLVEKPEATNTDRLDVKSCAMQGIVTSIDAFVGGLTLLGVGGGIFIVISGVFSVTAIMTFLGLVLGKTLKEKLLGKEKYVSSILFILLAVFSLKDAILV